MMHGKFCGPGKSTRAVLLFCLAFFLVAPAAAVWAETDVSGTLSADTTWTLAGSPYVVSGGILVAAGATLTIEPGVTVKFNANLALKIDGTLIARGTSGANITFTSSNPAPAPGDWGYILFTDTSTDAAFDANGDYVSGSILEYATVMYAGSTYASPGGAVGIMSSYPFINHCTITSNAKGAIAANNLNDNPAKTLKITHNIISHNTFASSGAAGIYIWSAGAVLIAGNRITRNTGASGGGGINLFYGVSVTVSNNIITHNTSSGDGGGIYMYRSDPVAVSGNIVAGNTATGGGGGILSSDGKVTFSGNLIFDNSAPNSPGVNLASNDVLTYNTITGNTASDSAPTTALFAGRLYGGRTDPRLNYNNLYGNSATYQFWNDNSQAAPPYLNARSNWWGKGAEADVAAAVYDFVDDSSKGTVDYSLPETAIRSDVPISPPTGLAVNPGGNPGEITISWNPNSESDLAGYRVYWGPENTYPFPNMVDAGNATSHTLTGLAPGLYQVGVTAYDATDASIANDPASPVYQKQTSGHESWHATLAAYSDSHTLTVAKTGTGSGTVTSSPAGVDCGSGCLAAYPSGTQVALSAKAAAGSTFTGWSGGCTGTAPCTVTTDADTAVTAAFTSNTAPVANAGNDRIILSEVTLDAGQSYDPDGTLSSYQWQLTHRTDSSANRSASGPTPTLSNLAPGYYDVTLTVADNHGETATNTRVLGVIDPSGLYTKGQLDQAAADAVLAERLRWDVNSDNKISLEEAIRALQIVAGARPE